MCLVCSLNAAVNYGTTTLFAQFMVLQIAKDLYFGLFAATVIGIVLAIVDQRKQTSEQTTVSKVCWSQDNVLFDART